MRYGTGGEEPMTSWGKLLRGAALATGAVVVLAGCGDSTGGTPTPATSALPTTSATKSSDPDAALWNPCDLPESAISGTGLDPASKEKDVAGVDFTGWKVCGWRASSRWYDLTIFSGTPTLDEYMQRPDFEHFVPQTVGSRRAVEFLDVGDTQRLGCSIAIAVRGGTVSFGVLTRYSVGKQGDPCIQVHRHVDDLVKYLPGS
ncbi:DUF3558 domain-containing protein [Nocardia araoensis]|uniref:DUF3558 domain-containing protein n=1 Tax=Nocardia araoensis TaxID=228600 RepID=UPI000A0628F1|nr:DUF3558 domain-containing protein [Nocardia araoensis]